MCAILIIYIVLFVSSKEYCERAKSAMWLQTRCVTRHFRFQPLIVGWCITSACTPNTNAGRLFPQQNTSFSCQSIKLYVFGSQCSSMQQHVSVLYEWFVGSLHARVRARHRMKCEFVHTLTSDVIKYQWKEMTNDSNNKKWFYYKRIIYLLLFTTLQSARSRVFWKCLEMEKNTINEKGVITWYGSYFSLIFFFQIKNNVIRSLSHSFIWIRRRQQK